MTDEISVESNPADNSSEDNSQLMNPADITASFLKTFESLQDAQLTSKDKLDSLNKLVEFRSNYAVNLQEIVPLEKFVKSLRGYLLLPTKTLRTASLRVLRYFMKDEDFIKEMIRQKVHYFIARSLDREKQSEAERMQALKIVRRIMEINCHLLPPIVVHSLVSIAEHSEDNFCRVSVETICEITIRNPQLSSHCNGIKVLLNAILEPSYAQIQESLVLALIYLINEEETRKYVRPDLDVATILAPFTDNFAGEAKPEKDKKWNAAIRALITILKSWTGLIYVTRQSLGLKTLVDALRLPSPELHDKILDALFDIFRLAVQKNSNPFKFSNQNHNLDEGLETGGLDLPSRTRGERHNLLNNYLSALLIAFIQAGLIEVLGELGCGRRLLKDQEEFREDLSKPEPLNVNHNIAVKATLLLGELLYLTNTLLPSSHCARVQTLPGLVEYAASFSLDPRLRSSASSMVSNLHQYHHLKHTSSIYDFHLSLIVTGANKWRRLKGKDRRLDRMDEVKMKIDLAMDIDQLRNKIQDTQVTVTKDSQRWNWDLISDIMDGPFNNSTLVSFTLQKTKFVNRILSFLRPTHKLFSKLPWNTANLKYVRISCQLLEVLVSSDAGRDFLLNNKLIPEIADLLKIELEKPEEGKNKDSRLLSPEKVLKTMAREYFTMLGTLSSSARGIDVLKKYNIFKYLIDLSELQGRDDLCHLIMTSLDYNMSVGDSRVILAKALVSQAKVVRYLATRHMRVLLRAGVQEFSNWGIELLVKQLNDEDAKVGQIALVILDEACDEVDCLDSLIAKRPNHLLTMGAPGKNLYLRMLSRPSGFKYLSETSFVEEELNLWREKQNSIYVTTLESNLAEAFFPSLYKTHNQSDQSGDGVYLLPHFYGELSKTTEGCQLLEKSGDVQQLIQTVKDPSSKPLQKRSALWALGHIGSSKTGFKFLEKDNVLNLIVSLVETSPCLSIRGTCWYVLGMISKIEAEALEALGWESPKNVNSCIAVPKNIQTTPFFQVPGLTYEGSFANLQFSAPLPAQEKSEKAEIQKEIITAVTNLSNFISAESASRTLKRLKAQHPEEFNVTLLLQIFNFLGTYKFRLPVRRFIYDIFDINWADQAVLDQLDK